MKYLLTFLALALCCGTGLCSPAIAAEPAESISQIDKNLTTHKAILVDVREEKETDQGYIDGALLVPLSLLQEGKDTEGFDKLLSQRLSKKQVVYCYCSSGGRAVTAVDVLKKYGYNARALKWGYRDLAKEGFVTAKPKKPQ